MRQITLGDTIYFWFATNDSAGSGGDPTSPVFDVRLAGAASSAAPVLSGSATLLSHANYPNGCLEVEIVATSGNGFAVGEYGIFATCAISAQNPVGFIGGFEILGGGSVTAHFTDRTTTGHSAVQSVSGRYTVHTSGTWDGAVLTLKGGPTGSDPADYALLRTFAEGNFSINMDLAGDVRFSVASAGGSTSITAIIEEVVL